MRNTLIQALNERRPFVGRLQPYLAFDNSRGVHVIVQSLSGPSPLTVGRLNEFIRADSVKWLLDAIASIGPLCTTTLRHGVPRLLSLSSGPNALSILSRPHIDKLAEDLEGLLRPSRTDYLSQANLFAQLSGWSTEAASSILAASSAGVQIAIEPLADWMLARSLAADLVRMSSPPSSSRSPAFGTITVQGVPEKWSARVACSSTRIGDFAPLLKFSSLSHSRRASWFNPKSVCALLSSEDIPGSKPNMLWFAFKKGKERPAAETILRSLQNARANDGSLVGWDLDFNNLLDSPMEQSIRCGSRFAELIRLSLYHPGMESARCVSCGRGFLRPSTRGKGAVYCSSRCRKAGSRKKFDDDSWKLVS